jgi:hypothetical protein
MRGGAQFNDDSGIESIRCIERSDGATMQGASNSVKLRQSPPAFVPSVTRCSFEARSRRIAGRSAARFAERS